MTTSIPPREPDDDLPDEVGLKALYDQLPRNEPGPALDAAVLRAAAQALSADPQATRQNAESVGSPGSARKDRPRWLIGVSSAATLVLAAGLAWHMRGMPQADIEPTVTHEAASAQANTPAIAPAAPVAAMAEPQIAPPLPPPSEPAKPPPPALEQSHQPKKRVAAKPQVVPGIVGAARRHAAAASSYQRAAAPRSMANAPDPVAEVSDSSFSMDGKATPAAPLIRAQVVLPPAPPAPPASSVTATQAASPAQAHELDEIRRLFAEHKDQQAQQRLEQFHRTHPQWRFAPDLEARLPKP